MINLLISNVKEKCVATCNDMFLFKVELEEGEAEEATDSLPSHEIKRPRSRIRSTSSDKSAPKLTHQISRQTSRQLSIQSEKGKGEKAEEVEEVGS